MGTNGWADSWALRHPGLTGLAVVVLSLAALLGWHEYESRKSTPTASATLATDIRMHNLYKPFDSETLRGGSLIHLVCEIRAGDSIGAYGALASDNLYVNVGTEQIEYVPGERLPECKPAGGGSAQTLVDGVG